MLVIIRLAIAASANELLCNMKKCNTNSKIVKNNGIKIKG